MINPLINQVAISGNNNEPYWQELPVLTSKTVKVPPSVCPITFPVIAPALIPITS